VLDVSDCEPLDCFRCPHCEAVVEVSAQIDRYIAVDVAGRGGMGVVYKAYDPSLDRYVALKLLRKDRSADGKLVEQLETEASITAAMNDPHVVRVYGTGRDRGRFFIAMELVDKGSLDDLIKLQGRVAESQVLEVGIQMARGLKAAQQHGLIHRDVKPGNVLFGEGRTAKLVDFGLAVFQSEEEKVRGEIWGTPYYVAPEKLDNQPEDFRSDMYSLGGTLFHALAGRPPFEAENASLVALKHLKSQAVSLQAFAPWVSSATAHIINRTLHKNPAQRFQTYDELIENLEYAREQLGQHGTAPVQRTRVVLETEEDQKNYLWVTLGMIAAAVLLLVGFFVFKGKLTEQTALASPVPDAIRNPSHSSGRHPLHEGLELLADGSDGAAKWFSVAAGNAGLKPDDRAWAQMFNGAAHLIGGQLEDARGAFEGVAHLSRQMKDSQSGAFLEKCAARLMQSDSIPRSEVETLNRGSHEAIGLLLYGLHEWHVARPAEGVALLREFRKAKPGGAAAWIESLKPVASGFIERQSEFEMLASEYLASKSEPFRREIMAKIERFGAPFAAQIAALPKPDDVPKAAPMGALGKFEPGIYRIVNKRDGRVIDASSDGQGSVGLWDYFENDNQLWEFLERGEGVYQLICLAFDKALDVPHSQKEEGLNIQIWERNDTDAQRWRFVATGDGAYHIISLASGLHLDAAGQDNGARIQQKIDDGQDDKRWIVERVR
jgi:serine/threonine protein kinase